MRTPIALLLLAFALPAASPAQKHSNSHRPKVVIISLDAFPAETLHDPLIAAPTLHRLMKTGAYARSMQPINPTVTWPNHTAIITGQDASHHHVLVNGLIVDQRTDKEARIDAQATKDQLVAVPTLYDLAHQAGMTTAEVDWVAIMHASTIDWSFAEKPNPDGVIERELIAAGTATRDELAQFNAPRQAWRDRLYTAAAVDILRKHHPDLLMVHLLALDSIEHHTGFGTDADYNTIAFLDDRVKEIMDAVQANGDTARTTFLIVSDHGQASIHKRLHPSFLLNDAGLESPTSPTPTSIIEEDGYALLYQKNSTPASIADLKKLFTGKPGVRSVLTPDEAAAYGWPTPAQTTQAPDLLLYAMDDYGFTEGKSDAFVADSEQRGVHGYPNTDPLMQAIFIAHGAAIQPRGEFPAISNLDVAPTIAHILGLKLPDAQDKPLLDILK
jgi:predicted AlkP superfamily pyrophosphatase or phosphodiesterase